MIQRLIGSRLVVGLAVIIGLCVPAAAQETVDHTVAVVNDGVRSELITYSDLIWQLALQPNAPLDPPRTEDLNAVLLSVIDQRIFALEAERLPRAAPTPKEIADEIARTLAYFPSTAVFEARLRTVGFASIKDENFERLIIRRVSIDKYIDFRFRSFVVITPEDEARYYREVFTPDFRKKYPGLLLPALDDKRGEITGILTEQRVAARIETFLDDAKRRVGVEIISEP
jgi:hypothetical protein